jgi:hypothetical protein
VLTNGQSAIVTLNSELLSQKKCFSSTYIIDTLTTHLPIQFETVLHLAWKFFPSSLCFSSHLSKLVRLSYDCGIVIHMYQLEGALLLIQPITNLTSFVASNFLVPARPPWIGNILGIITPRET